MYTDDERRDRAQVTFLDLPLLASLLFQNTRSRRLIPEPGLVEVWENLPPEAGVHSYEDGGDFVASDAFGQYYLRRRRLGVPQVHDDGSARILINGGSPITLAVKTPQYLAVHPDLPVKNVAELVALAKTRDLSYASVSVGSASHLTMEMLKSAAKVDLAHVPYRGAAPAVADLVGGQVQAAFMVPGNVQQFAKEGKLRLIACAVSRLDIDPRVARRARDPRSGATRAAERIADGASAKRSRQEYGGGVYFVLRSDAREAAELLLEKEGKDRAALAALVRDVAGNPFRPCRVEAARLTPAVSRLAAAAYEERDHPSGHLDPARLAVLADALEDAGRADPELLGHLRAPGPHVRGCRALDLVLGKQ